MDRDRLIERYMSGQMSVREEQEFLRLAGNDESVRRMVEAERTIRGVIRNDRQGTRLPSADPSARLMAKLAATPVPPSGGTPPASSAPSTGATFGSSGFMKFALITVTILGVVIGALFVAPWLTTTQPPSTKIEQPAAVPSTGNTRSTPAPGTPTESPAISTPTTETQSPELSNDRASPSQAPAAREVTTPRQKRSPEPRPVENNPVEHATPSTPTQPEPTKAATVEEEPAVFDVDSVRMRMNVTTPKTR